MTDLLLSIVLNAWLGVIFGFFPRFRIDSFQAIVFNYWTCVITGSLALGYFPLGMHSLQQPWLPFAGLMGVLFISVFSLIAYSSAKVGVTITQMSNRLSMVIPVVVAVLFYDEAMPPLKVAGLLLALVAVVLSSRMSGKERGTTGGWAMVLPLLLFAGSGIIDTLTKYAERSFLQEQATANSYLIAGFGTAALCGTLTLAWLYATGRRRFAWRNVAGGLVLGIPNYFSIFFLIRALQHPGLSSSATIPINNIGVLLVVSLVGLLVFRERLSRANYLGLLFTLVAILLIYLGDQT